MNATGCSSTRVEELLDGFHAVRARRQPTLREAAMEIQFAYRHYKKAARYSRMMQQFVEAKVLYQRIGDGSVHLSPEELEHRTIERSIHAYEAGADEQLEAIEHGLEVVHAREEECEVNAYNRAKALRRLVARPKFLHSQLASAASKIQWAVRHWLAHIHHESAIDGILAHAHVQSAAAQKAGAAAQETHRGRGANRCDVDPVGDIANVRNFDKFDVREAFRAK